MHVFPDDSIWRDHHIYVGYVRYVVENSSDCVSTVYMEYFFIWSLVTSLIAYSLQFQTVMGGGGGGGGIWTRSWEATGQQLLAVASGFTF